MKINWGTKLVIAMAVFMTMIIIFVVLMFREDINLVESDYYPKGQRYQEVIDKRQHSDALKEKLTVGLENGLVWIQVPKTMESKKISGNVHFYHRVESKKDFTVDLIVDTNNIFKYNAENLHGRYILKVEWNYDKTSYFNEESINIP